MLNYTNGWVVNKTCPYCTDNWSVNKTSQFYCAIAGGRGNEPEQSARPLRGRAQGRTARPVTSIAPCTRTHCEAECRIPPIAAMRCTSTDCDAECGIPQSVRTSSVASQNHSPAVNQVRKASHDTTDRSEVESSQSTSRPPFHLSLVSPVLITPQGVPFSVAEGVEDIGLRGIGTGPPHLGISSTYRSALEPATHLRELGY